MMMGQVVQLACVTNTQGVSMRQEVRRKKRIKMKFGCVIGSKQRIALLDYDHPLIYATKMNNIKLITLLINSKYHESSSLRQIGWDICTNVFLLSVKSPIPKKFIFT